MATTDEQGGGGGEGRKEKRQTNVISERIYLPVFTHWME